ncbi:hypothetical protein CLOP_g17674 [Closterium sp. NIES-67]|nr:hypothetical protein CLOP_g17674 [Closterium sp. NIES-67]
MAPLATSATAAATRVERPSISTTPLALPNLLLMSPGPSSPHPRVLAAAGSPLVGHMHPALLSAMDDVREWLKYVFQTRNRFTLGVSGSGHAAMEAAVNAVVAPGDVALVAINGMWGERMALLARRHGGDVRTIQAPLGEVFSLDDFARALEANPGVASVFVVHGESSTGTLQPLEGLGDLCHKHGALLVVDAICTAGGVPVLMDEWDIDVCYSGSQKCLSSLVSPSPFTMNERAREKLKSKAHQIQTYYFDMNVAGAFWAVDGKPNVYHHTSIGSNIMALREALALVVDEGLESVWHRHRSLADKLHAGIEELGLELFVKDPSLRLPTVTTIKVPEGVHWAQVTSYLMEKYNLEIAGGLGPTVGMVWRIGIMGNNARDANIALVLRALKDALHHVGFLPPPAHAAAPPPAHLVTVAPTEANYPCSAAPYPGVAASQTSGDGAAAAESVRPSKPIAASATADPGASAPTPAAAVSASVAVAAVVSAAKGVASSVASSVAASSTAAPIAVK